MNKQVHNNKIVELLCDSMRDGDAGLKNVPALLKKLLHEKGWAERYIPRLKKVQRFERFSDFVDTPPLEGLGATVQQLQRLCRDDAEVLDLIDKEVRGKRGGDRKSESIKDNNVNYDLSTKGNSATYGLSRLRKSAPEYHAKVIAGELSVNAAMVKVGFRKPMANVPKTREGFVAYIKRTFSAADIRWIREQLE